VSLSRCGGAASDDPATPVPAFTTVISPGIIPIQQLYGTFPTRFGVNSITFSPGRSSCLIPYSPTINR
jgi:hypothetical protein